MELWVAIKQWNGKSKEDIAEIYAEFSSREAFVDKLIDLLCSAECESGASWLLKAWCEQNGKLSASQSHLIVRQLADIKSWQTKLHILQSFDFLTFEAADESAILAFVRQSLQETNKFVRAWAYDGYFRLAKQFPAYQSEVKDYLEMALIDEPASVKARVRNLLKTGFS